MEDRTTSANRVTWIGFLVNLVLTALKFAAGVLGHSGAMVADAVHSLSDFATDIVVLASFRVVGKPADNDHAYGHGKYETLATATIGGALLAVGAGVFWGGATKIRDILQGVSIGGPKGIALAAAIVSIVVKEWLYRYTRGVGDRIGSPAVVANAWHHRSDAGSSVGTMLGIGGAIMLGKPWHILDPVAAVVVSLFIVRVAFGILSGSVKELAEESLDEDTRAEILRIAASFEDVTHPHNLRTRRIGGDIAVDLHIRVAPDMPVVDAHAITSRMEALIRERFGPSTFVSIHVEPETVEEHMGASA